MYWKGVKVEKAALEDLRFRPALTVLDTNRSCGRMDRGAGIRRVVRTDVR